MQSELIRATPGASASRRIVLIPGANQTVHDLEAAGFVSAVRERRLDIDIVLVTPEPAHLLDRSMLVQLHTDVVVPARSAGCTSMWLAGISWGGFLALLYAAGHPGQLEGICLLAPYLGQRTICTEIHGFGSLAAWSAGTACLHDALAEDRSVWRYIAGRTAHRAPKLYLAFGRDDRFGEAQRLLAGLLPAGAVDIVGGEHHIDVWRQLWDRFLDWYAGAASAPLLQRGARQ